jgi:hypothetical protein
MKRFWIDISCLPMPASMVCHVEWRHATAPTARPGCLCAYQTAQPSASGRVS